MNIYRISNHVSGADLGFYVGDDEDDAIAAMNADAGHDGPADPALVAQEWDGWAALRAEAVQHGDFAMVTVLDLIDDGAGDAADFWLVADALNHARG